LLLCEFEGLSVEEAARRLKCPVGTIKSRLARARERLRRRLTSRGIGREFDPSVMPPVSTSLVQLTASLAGPAEAGGRGVAYELALVAWESTVLRAMLMSRLAIAGTILGLVLLTGGVAMLAVGQATGPAAPKPSNVGGAMTSRDTDDVLAALAVRRLALARQLRDDVARLFRAGEVSLANLNEAEMRVLDAELAVCSTEDQRVGVLRETIKTGSSTLHIVKELYKKDQVTRSQVSLAELNLIEIQNRLAETLSAARRDVPGAGGIPPRPGLGTRPNRETAEALKRELDRMRKGAVDAEASAASGAVIDRFTKQQLIAALESLMERPVQLRFAEPPRLDQALKGIKEQSQGPFDNGAPIYVDPAALQKLRLTMESTIKVRELSGTIGEALRTLLDPIGMKFSLENGIVAISAK
jgi:hypothetical protein